MTLIAPRIPTATIVERTGTRTLGARERDIDANPSAMRRTISAAPEADADPDPLGRLASTHQPRDGERSGPCTRHRLDAIGRGSRRWLRPGNPTAHERAR